MKQNDYHFLFAKKENDKICFKENSGFCTTRDVLQGERKCLVVYLFSNKKRIIYIFSIMGILQFTFEPFYAILS